MDFTIEKLYQGDTLLERVALLCSKDADIGDYLIMDDTYDSKGNLSNIFRHVFKFPKQLIKKGEWVILMTGTGSYSFKDANHFFHVGSKSDIWNDKHDAVTLIKIAAITKKKFSDIHIKK